jgi:hypothetical protein
MTHAQFAALLPSEKKRLLDAAAEKMAFPASVETFVSDMWARTYATVRLHDRDEFVTYLVVPGSTVHFENGHYGFRSLKDALDNMFHRAR